jgi:hypothetical protein
MQQHFSSMLNEQVFKLMCTVPVALLSVLLFVLLFVLMSQLLGLICVPGGIWPVAFWFNSS